MIYLLGPRRFPVGLVIALAATNIGTALALAAVLAVKPAIVERVPRDLVAIAGSICDVKQAMAYAAGYVAGQNRAMVAIGRADLLTPPLPGADRYAEIAARHGFRRAGDAP
jgi:hypothetical protein